jgi:hypothetical protein
VFETGRNKTMDKTVIANKDRMGNLLIETWISLTTFFFLNNASTWLPTKSEAHFEVVISPKKFLGNTAHLIIQYPNEKRKRKSNGSGLGSLRTPLYPRKKKAQNFLWGS